MPMSHRRRGELRAPSTAASGSLRPLIKRPHGLHHPAEFLDQVREQLTFCGAHPTELTRSAPMPELQEPRNHVHPFLGVNITFQVMAVTEVSPKDEDPIEPAL